MVSATLNIPITGDLKDYVEARVAGGSFGTPAEYVRELILDERDRRLARLEDRLIQASKGPFIEITAEEWEREDIMAIAEERLSQLK